MNLRPAAHIPLPWLAAVASKIPRRGKFRRKVLRLPRSLKPTREGKFFIAVLFFIGIAAINTGNNLLYLVLASLLSLIIISGIMSESTLRGITIRRAPLPRYIHKGRPATLRLTARNRKRLLPSYSFLVEELDSGIVAQEPAYALKLGAGDEVLLKARYTFLKRGRFELRGLKISTSFPFGLFVKGREEDSAVEVTVFPGLKPVERIPPISSAGHEGSLSAHGRDRGEDLRRLREYTPEDDSRFIHWRSAAKLKKLLVKEFERESEKKATVVFENRCHEGGEEAFEALVDEAASLVSHLIERGYAVGLKTLGEKYPPGRGERHLITLLSALATIAPVAQGRPALGLEGRGGASR